MWVLHPVWWQSQEQAKSHEQLLEANPAGQSTGDAQPLVRQVVVLWGQAVVWVALLG